MRVKIADLKPHPFNKLFGALPEEEFNSLKDDIATRGMQTAIDITEDNVIVCGHQRVRACKELKIETIEARVLKGLSEDQIKEHLIKDNILRRQLNAAQIVAAGQELEKIYAGRVGRPDKDKLPTNVGNSDRHERETSSLVAKDFGISGRTYERMKEAAKVVEESKEEHPEIEQKWKEADKHDYAKVIRDVKKKDDTEDTTQKILVIFSNKNFKRIEKESDKQHIEPKMLIANIVNDWMDKKGL